MNDRLKKIILIVLGLFVIFFIFLFIISSCDKKFTPKQLETEIIENAKSYFDLNENELPQKNNVMTLSLGDLVNKGIISDLTKMLNDDINCSGNLIIENNNNYYMYSANLNCSGAEEYKTNNLKELLLKDVVTSGNGLYNLGTSYYFRGETINNYINFDGIIWRISKINEDNSIRLIESGSRESVVWDDRYNDERQSNTGINNYVNTNNVSSRIKEYLDNVYSSENFLSNDAKGFIKETNLCVGKRSLEDTINDGSLECSSTIDNQYIGLLQLNEYLIASLDPNCKSLTSYECSNYNYLAGFDNLYWTITASSDNNYHVYKVTADSITVNNASTSGMARMVINISENTNVTGTGTEEDPYVVIGTSSEIKDLNK